MGLAVPVNEHDHAQGPPGADLVLVTYADFECPHCALVHPVVMEVARELRDSLRLVYRHFPLTDLHPHAQRAAEAAEAAAKQGRFWEMASQLFAHQDQLEDEFLLRYAKKSSVDAKRVSKELESGVHAARVRSDYLGGLRSGVQGTPSLFINGERYEGAFHLDALVGALLEASRRRR